jgi:Photosynthetic reaction centre cytochrome C subunit
MNKKIFIYTGIGLFITVGIAATSPPREKPDWKNVKVIPKNTDEEQMERIMYKYTKQLSVTCIYCHPPTKPDVFPKDVDFASEENPKKLITRDMMRMTDKLNKKYFGYKNDYSMNSFTEAVITCNTCHRGVHKPNNIKLFKGSL